MPANPTPAPLDFAPQRAIGWPWLGAPEDPAWAALLAATRRRGRPGDRAAPIRLRGRRWSGHRHQGRIAARMAAPSGVPQGGFPRPRAAGGRRLGLAGGQTHRRPAAAPYRHQAWRGWRALPAAGHRRQRGCGVHRLGPGRGLQSAPDRALPAAGRQRRSAAGGGADQGRSPRTCERCHRGAGRRNRAGRAGIRAQRQGSRRCGGAGALAAAGSYGGTVRFFPAPANPPSPTPCWATTG